MTVPVTTKSETTPFGKAALRLGVSSVVAGALIAIGNIAYYGFGLSSQPSALEHLNSGTWSEEVKSKIQSTYMYLLFSFYLVVISGLIVFNDSMLVKIFSSPLIVLADFLVQTTVQNGKMFARLDNRGIFSTQRLAWIAYCAFLGGITSPAFLMGLKTAKVSIHLTCIIVTGLIILSLVAPAGKFTSWKYCLNIFEIVVFIASIGAAVFPIRTTPGAIFFSLSFYGGLILYPSNFLFHSQDAQLKASEDTDTNIYCAMALSVPMLLDAISIFGRIVVMVPPAEAYH